MCSVYSIYIIQLGVIGCFVLSFFYMFYMYETLLFFILRVPKKSTKLSIEPILANPRIVLCSVVYILKTVRFIESLLAY
jgi:hypothetical protein